uniref:Uncharacterized protein n=1 Tax=Arcella intermedia TaxID=1963864 RepID=A0A6B2L8C6_9EUKA
MSFDDWNNLLTVNKLISKIVLTKELWRPFVFEKSFGADSAVPSPRVCHSAVVYNKKMYIYGGHNPDPGSNYISNLKDDLYTYDFDSNEWCAITVPNALSRTEHSAVIHKNEMFVFGGYSGTGAYQNKIIALNLDDPQAWVTVSVAGPIPTARSAHSACLYKGKIYVFGGWDGRTSNNDFYKFNIEKLKWSKVNAKGDIPEARRSHGCTVHGTSMYIFGGYNGIQNLPPDLFQFNFETKEWSVVKAKGEPPCGRSRLRIIQYYNNLAVFGGWDRVTHFPDWHRFDLETNTWTTTVLDMPLGGAGQHSTVLYNGSCYIFGGYYEKEKTSVSVLWGYFLGKY